MPDAHALRAAAAAAAAVAPAAANRRAYAGGGAVPPTAAARAGAASTSRRAGSAAGGRHQLRLRRRHDADPSNGWSNGRRPDAATVLALVAPALGTALPTPPALYMPYHATRGRQPPAPPLRRLSAQGSVLVASVGRGSRLSSHSSPGAFGRRAFIRPGPGRRPRAPLRAGEEVRPARALTIEAGEETAVGARWSRWVDTVRSAVDGGWSFVFIGCS